MKKFKYSSSHLMVALLLYPCLMLIGCSTVTETKNIKISESKITVCKDPRPQICTMEYLPVCATKKDATVKTYANGCTACSDKNVVNYREGACE